MAGTEATAVEDMGVGVVEAAAEGVLTPEKVSSPPRDELRELRLALVCYGGVSLAIYMHGITKEINKLVLASAAFERDQQSNPFGPDDSAHEYWDVLRARQEATGVRTRVVVDIISGTSAGGINGVFLAAAIARNRSQEPLRRVWLEKGDIKKLLAGPTWLPAFAKAPLFLYRSVRHPLSMKPPLRGDVICEWLNGAFAEMDASPREPLADLESLIPARHRLQLFVPITDFVGYDVRIPLDDPAWVSDRTHRQVMRFIHDGTTQLQLSPEWNDALAFSARATSSFPGAFPPLSIGDYENVGGHRLAAEVQETLFPGHFLANRPPGGTYFVDGGVLDNKPFGTTLDAIKLRPAANEVDRRLLYIEPDPGAELEQAPNGERPAWLATILGGYAGIPRKEPILDDLNGLAQHNANVERIRDIIESSFDSIRERVIADVPDSGDNGGRGPMPVIGPAALTAWRRTLTDAADQEAGFGYPTYLRLRMRAVIEDYATLIAGRRNYPAGSTHAHFVRRVLREWAVARGLLERQPAATDSQRQFLDSLDMGYEDRHLRFVIAALSWWYRGTEADTPTRDQLDRAKYQLYRRLDELQDVALALTRNPAVSDLIGQVFAKGAIDDALRRRETATEVLAAHADTLERLAAGVGSVVGEQLDRVRLGTDEDLATLTQTWTPWARQELLVRHIAFRFWDVLVYPVEALSGVNERDHVEVLRISPHEATTIVANPGDKNLKGVTLGHFGAFFSRKGRENDYLWGRLDGADRLVAVLQTTPGSRVETPSPDTSRAVFEAILRSEEPALANISDVVKSLQSAVGALGR
jgi:patatin-related protein